MILSGRARLPMYVHNHNKSCDYVRIGSGRLAAKPLLLMGVFKIFIKNIFFYFKKYYSLKID